MIIYIVSCTISLRGGTRTQAHTFAYKKIRGNIVSSFPQAPISSSGPQGSFLQIDYTLSGLT